MIVSPISIETVYKVWDDKHGVCLEIMNDCDGGSLIRILTSGKDSTEWFGKVDFCISADMAEALSKVLMKKAQDIRQEETK